MHKSLLFELIQFLRTPSQQAAPQMLVKEKIKSVIVLLSWTLLTILIVGASLLILMDKTNFEGTNVLESFVQSESVTTILLNSAIIAPSIEETLFRLPLVNQTPNLAVAFAAGTAILLAQTTKLGLLYILPAIPILTLGLTQILNKKNIKKVRENIFKRHFGVIFYISAIAFGSAHLLNYQSIEKGAYIAPFLVVPQMIIGLILGFVRIRYGFKYAILFHSLYNTTLLAPALLLRYNQENSVPIQIYGVTITLLLGYGIVTFLEQAISHRYHKVQGK